MYKTHSLLDDDAVCMRGHDSQVAPVRLCWPCCCCLHGLAMALAPAWQLGRRRPAGCLSAQSLPPGRRLEQAVRGHTTRGSALTVLLCMKTLNPLSGARSCEQGALPSWCHASWCNKMHKPERRVTHTSSQPGHSTRGVQARGKLHTRLKAEKMRPGSRNAPADSPKPTPPSSSAKPNKGSSRNMEAALKVTAVPIASPAARSPKISGPVPADAFGCSHTGSSRTLSALSPQLTLLHACCQFHSRLDAVMQAVQLRDAPDASILCCCSALEPGNWGAGHMAV